jgi:imidazolonepropionase-like amidohydrolase
MSATALGLAPSCRAPSAAQPGRALAWTGVTVVDGTGAAARPGQTLVVRAGRIAALGPDGEVPLPADVEMRASPGRFVVPGFVDLHVHLPQDRAVQEELLCRLLKHGVTTVLQPGARPGAGVELRERIARGEVRGPRLLTAGPSIDATRADGVPGSGSRWVSSELEVRREVRAQAETGVDWIKLYSGLPPELVQAAVDEAHGLGLPVALHAGRTRWGEAARAGVDMLVHSGFGTPMDEVVDLPDPAAAADREWYEAYARATEGAAFARLVEALVAARVVVVPTLAITLASGLGDGASLLPRFRPDLAPDADLDDWWGEGWRQRHPQYDPDSDEEAELLRTVYFPGALAIVRAYHERGVRLGVGTDVGNAWITAGHAFHLELELYQEAGIPALDVLRMATREGAAALGLLDELGTVEVGKRADLVFLGEDLTRDVRASRTIEAVYLGGVRVLPGQVTRGASGPYARAARRP